MLSVYDQKPWQKAYPKWLPKTLAFSEETVLDRFCGSVSRSPGDPCICYFSKTYSYKEINQMAVSVCSVLEQSGIVKGDRVIVLMQNIPQAVIASIAVWMLSAVVVPLNPMYTVEDLNCYLKDCGARFFFCQDDFYEEKVKASIGKRKDVGVVVTSPLDLLGKNVEIPKQFKPKVKSAFPGTRDFVDLIKEIPDEKKHDRYKPGPEDLAYLVYTSGTTGPSKGAMIRHRYVVHNATVFEKACRLDRNDIILGIAPLFHITGIVAHVAIAFHMGIPFVLFGRFDVDEVLRLIEKHNVSFTVAAITVYIALLNHPDPESFGLSRFKKVYSGGAPISPSTVDRFRKTFGQTIYNVYGLTESTSPATITPLGMEGPVDQEFGALSVGLVVPGHAAWIVDVDDPEKGIKMGQAGELVLQGPGIIDGYWERSKETANAIKDNRFFTSDIAKIDEHGWCYIVDRKKDLINASGFKVWPREVEDVLYRHLGVNEAAVVGVTDAYRGETVKAFVSLTKDHRGEITPDDLITFCKKQMAAYKYPRIVEIIEEVPKTVTGKFLRRKLRELKDSVTLGLT